MKPWNQVIRDHIDIWSAKLGSMSWWPNYVYHFTDVTNAANILNCGCLYSREEARNQGIMKVDNASPEVILQTNQDHLHYVRLYFRPRTPTQYRNEGIRPIGQRELGSHCPVPVYFCFDAFDILSRDDCEFSDGNMASPKALHAGNRLFFSKIPFNLVFHDGAIHMNEDKEEIKFRRHAEVLIPDCLRIEENLKLIICRSSAERQTLLQLLPEDIRTKWQNKVRLGDLFFDRKWTFVEEVTTVDDRIIFRFNPNTNTPGPFHVSFSYKDDLENLPRSWNGTMDRLDNTIAYRVNEGWEGIAKLTLDDSLAFYGRVVLNAIPF